MPTTGIPVQSLVDMTNRRLSGWQNSATSDQILDAVNDGKDEIYALLKSLNQEYFAQQSQDTDNTQLNYFGDLSTSTRQYTLPEDLREINFIECTTQGYTDIIFTFRKPTDPDFRDTRMLANQQGTSSLGTGSTQELLFTITGKDQLTFASYPPAILKITLWYIRSLPDYEDGDMLDEILFPYVKKISDWAAKKIMLEAQEPSAWQAWMEEWKQGIITLTAESGPRNQANAEFAQEFVG